MVLYKAARAAGVPCRVACARARGHVGQVVQEVRGARLEPAASALLQRPACLPLGPVLAVLLRECAGVDVRWRRQRRRRRRRQCRRRRDRAVGTWPRGGHRPNQRLDVRRRRRALARLDHGKRPLPRCPRALRQRPHTSPCPHPRPGELADLGGWRACKGQQGRRGECECCPSWPHAIGLDNPPLSAPPLSPLLAPAPTHPPSPRPASARSPTSAPAPRRRERRAVRGASVRTCAWCPLVPSLESASR